MIDDEKQLFVPARFSATAASSDSGVERIISVKEAGRLLARGRTFLRTLHQRGELVPVAIGRHRIGYYRSEVLQWLASRPRKLPAQSPVINATAAAYDGAGGENGGETTPSTAFKKRKSRLDSAA